MLPFGAFAASFTLFLINLTATLLLCLFFLAHTFPPLF